MRDNYSNIVTRNRKNYDSKNRPARAARPVRMERDERRTYVCNKIGICNYLRKQGYEPYKIAPDKNDPDREVFLFTDSPELRNCVMDYITEHAEAPREAV